MESVGKLKRVTRIDSIPAESTYFNEQGFFHDEPIVTSTGIFEYALPDGGVRRELRLPEHVFDKESLASYAGKPVVITHNAGAIDKSNVMNEIVGTILSEGYQDKDNVRCKIVIHDIDKVKRVPYREMSLGYSLDLIEEPGVWNGEPYDAIQTNIRINHLAIVESARAGDIAHLNLDGKKVEIDDIENQEGGKKDMHVNITHGDGIDMTPEELLEAIKSYKATKAESPVEPSDNPAQPEDLDSSNVEPKATEPTEPQPVEPQPAEPVAEPVTEPANEPVAPEAEKVDGDVVALIDSIKKLLAVLEAKNCSEPKPNTDANDGADNADCAATDCAATEGDNADNGDSSDDLSQSLNNDSADDTFSEKLNICRIGDKLNLDGLESKSIVEGKKVIIATVLPNIRLDGKDEAYINAAYDLAVGEVNKRKDVDYQRNQMTAVPANREDSADNNVSMAVSARQRMLEREGGNK